MTVSYYSDCPDLDFCTETQEIFPFLKITRFGADFPRSCTGNNFLQYFVGRSCYSFKVRRAINGTEWQNWVRVLKRTKIRVSVFGLFHLRPGT